MAAESASWEATNFCNCTQLMALLYHDKHIGHYYKALALVAVGRECIVVFVMVVVMAIVMVITICSRWTIGVVWV